MKREIPRDANGNRLCEHCLVKPVPPSLGTKPRSYCSRNCRQRAYEARKTGKVVREAVAAAAARPATSRDVAESKSQVAPATTRDFLLAPPASPAPRQPVPRTEPPQQETLGDAAGIEEPKRKIPASEVFARLPKRWG